jgi:TonB family protein
MSSLENIFKKSLLISISFHLIIFVSFFISYKFNSPLITIDEINSSINVESISKGLPTVLKKDIGKISKSEKKPQMIYPIGRKIYSEKFKTLENIKKKLFSKTYIKNLKTIKSVTSPEGKEEETLKQAKKNTYINSIKTLIKNNWKIPHWIDRKNLNTVIELKINAINGNIKSLQITKSSGNNEFDNLAKNAITKAKPFPSPTNDIKDLIKEGILISFP